MSKLYTLEELTESIINDFKLDRSGEDAFHRYYQKIYRTLNACGFLKTATKKPIPAPNGNVVIILKSKKELFWRKKLYMIMFVKILHQKESKIVKNIVRYK